MSLLAINYLTEMEKFRHNFKFWNEYKASNKTKNLIKHEIKLVTIYVILNTLLSIACGISLVLPNEDEIQYHYFILMVNERVKIKKIRAILYYGYKFTFALMFPIMTINSHRILYVSRKLKFQIFLLEEFIQTMTMDYERTEIDDYKIVYNKNYQKNIKRKLKLIISRHLYILQ